MLFKINLRLLFSLLICYPIFGVIYTEQEVKHLDAGKNTVTITNLGSIGGTQTVTLPPLVTGSDYYLIWFTTPGIYWTKGSTVTCADPCGIEMYTEFGQIGYKYERYNVSNVLQSVSSALFTSFTPGTAHTSPFTVPATVHGFKNYTLPGWQFSVGSISTSGLRIYIYGVGMRNGITAAYVNNGPEHIAETKQITAFSAFAGTCTITTVDPHNIPSSTTVQLNFFHDTYDVAQSNPLKLDSMMNDTFTWTSTGVRTGTVSCSIGNGDWNGGLNAASESNLNKGKTISASTFLADEKKYFGGLESDHMPLKILLPLTSSEVIASATNTLYLRFKGDLNADKEGLFHGWYALEANILEPDFEMDQIVAVSNTCTARTTTTNNFVTNDTIHLRDTPGAPWQFDGYHVVTVVDGTHFSFTCGENVVNGTTGVAPFTTPDATYVVPTSIDQTSAHPAHMYAARALIPKSSFTAYDPTLPNMGGTVVNGRAIFQGTSLKEPNAFLNYTTGAHCSSCHDSEARDLKYYGFNPYVTYIAGIHRGLSDTQARDVTAWIQSLSVTTPTLGRPWNPPFQVAPGLDSTPIYDWAAGGGLQWVLNYDESSKRWVDLSQFLPAGTTNIREIPVYMPFPMWHQWLPEYSPEDVFTTLGLGTFSSDAMSTNFVSYRANQAAPTSLSSGINNSTTTIPVVANFTCTNNTDFIQVGFDAAREFMKVTAGCGTTSLTATRAQKGTSAVSHSSGEHVINYTRFQGSSQFIGIQTPYSGSAYAAVGKAIAGPWPSQTVMAQAPRLWGSVKLWELINTFELYNFVDIATNDDWGTVNARAAAQPKRGWYTNEIFYNGPHITVSCDIRACNFQNKGWYPSARGDNWSILTNRWYLAAPTINGYSRRYTFGSPLDINYYSSFSFDGGSKLRPGFYTNILGANFITQNTWGWPTIVNNPNPPMSLSILRTTNWVQLQYADLFTSVTDKKAAISAIVQELAAVTDPGVFSTATWQAAIPDANFGLSGCPLATVPDPGSASNFSAGNCYQSYLALLLAYANWAGTSSTYTNALVTWGNAVYTSSGHNFANDQSATCSYVTDPAQQGAAVPQIFRCTNF